MPVRVSLPVLILVALAAAACGSSDDDPVAEQPAIDFCAAAAAFAEADAATLEQDESAESRRAAARASVEAYTVMAAAAPESIRDEADTALEGQRGSFEALDQLGWSEDGLASVSADESDELLTELERFLGEEYLDAEEAVIEQVRTECDPTFLEG